MTRRQEDAPLWASFNQLIDKLTNFVYYGNQSSD